MQHFIIEYQLSDRELEVLKILAQAHTNKQIAEILKVCEKTIEFHTHNIYVKLGVKNRIEAVIKYIKSIN